MKPTSSFFFAVPALVALAGVALPVLPGHASPGRRPLPGANVNPAQFTQSLREDALREAKRAREKEGGAGEPAIKDAATHDQLAKVLKEAQREDPMKHMAPSEGDDPTKVNQPVDIVQNSDIICFRNLATLVPKKAILIIPENYKDRLELKPGAQICTWADFYAANRGWIKTVEVDRLQAEGNSPLPEDTTKIVEEATSIIVATFRGGPISVLPPKVPAATEENPLEPGAPVSGVNKRAGLTGKIVP